MNRKNYLAKMTGLEHVPAFLKLNAKTEELIKRLAMADCCELWNQADIAWAVAQTGVFDFSLDDVRYTREWLMDEQAIAYESIIGGMLCLMCHMAVSDRVAYYENRVHPCINEREEYKRAFKGRFTNLEYYAIAE